MLSDPHKPRTHRSGLMSSSASCWGLHRWRSVTSCLIHTNPELIGLG